MTEAQEKEIPAIRALRLDGSKACVEFTLRFFSDREMQSYFPDDERSMYSVYDAAKAVEQGLTIAYAIICRENGPIGMMWGTMLTPHTIVGHWGILQPFRRKGTAKQALEAVADQVRLDFPGVTSIMGIIAKRNVTSLAGALKCGFTMEGHLPKSHIHNGVLHDSWIVIKEIR